MPLPSASHAKATFASVKTDEKYYDGLEVAPRDQEDDINDHRFWSSDDEEDEESVT